MEDSIRLAVRASASMIGSNAVSTPTADPPSRAAPTATFAFTDLEGSTRLWERLPGPMKTALERHDAIIADAVETFNGQLVKGTGDGFMAVFATAGDAVRACLDAQHRLRHESWGDTGPLRVRMGLHSGVAEVRASDYYGPTVNRAARIMSAGHGGQVLLSSAAAALVVDGLPDGAGLRDLGEHRLKDLGRPERLFQLVGPGLDRDFPPLRAARRDHRLPIHASAFVGRGAELDEIERSLVGGAVRLLTLVGPGGTGKTRLALRAAADHADRFEDGVFFVDLSTVRDTESVLTAIARAVGLSEAVGQDMLAELTRHLHEQRALVVLDNFEQVTAAAESVVRLLQNCPGLELLVTSREALHVRDEHILAVPPLAAPGPAAGALSPEQLMEFEAVELFVERARATRPGFRLTHENAADVAEICVRLDGLPLAIELAAARLNVLSPKAIRQRLDDRLQLLRRGARDLPVRQQTLRATIEWSYRLLEPPERRLFELLSAFSGAGVEAVEVVAGPIGDLGEGEPDPLDGLASLVDKSLVRLTEPENGEARLVMLETIGEYAAERLSDLPEFSAAVRRGHAAYFADFARRRWRELGAEEREAALAPELENLRTAWRYWAGEEDLEHLEQLVDALWLLYEERGWYQAMVDLTTDLLALLSRAPSTPERAAQHVTLQTSRARALLAAKGYTEDVEDAYTRALELLKENPDLPQLFPVLRGLSSFYTYRGEFEKGAHMGREIMRLAESQGDRGMLVDGHFVLGASLAFLDDLHGGLKHLDEALACSEAEQPSSRRFRLGNNPRVAGLTTSAFILWMLGFPDRARERADAAVALALDLEHPFTSAFALFHSAFLHLWRREPALVGERARQVLEVADDHEFEIWRAVGTCLAGAANSTLDHDEGLDQIREGMRLYQDLKTPPVFWPLLLYVQSGALVQSGRAVEGLALIEEAFEIAGRSAGMTLVPEFLMHKGDLLSEGTDAERASAEALYEQALALARGLDARMWQLRAATRLCRAARHRGEPEEGHRLLRSVFETFTEGFTLPDLVDARELLES